MGVFYFMRFVSTRGDNKTSWSLREAIFAGFASDGGMFMPETIPELTPQQLSKWSEAYLENPQTFPLFHQIAVDVLSLFIEETEIPKADLQKIIKEAITFPIRVSHLTKNEKNESCILRSDDPSFHPNNITWALNSLHILELFNGPTFTFKDIGMQFLGRVMAYLLDHNEERKEKITIIVATSGDTGSAAIHAVENHPLIDLYVLYPGENRISELQERQMATNTAENIFCIRFDGSSDDADVVVTKLFENKNLSDKRLTTLNSVNIGRILMQSVHFIFSYVQCLAPEIVRCVKDNEKLPLLRFCIPTGGLGNGSSCYLASRMGLPVDKIIMAVNENDTISRTLGSGIFKMKPVKVTNAPAMDICNPYNIERLIFLMSGRKGNVVRDFIAAQNDENGAVLGDEIFDMFKRHFISYSADQSAICCSIKKYLIVGEKLLTHTLLLLFMWLRLWRVLMFHWFVWQLLILQNFEKQ